jgi:hypothetical protein
MPFINGRYYINPVMGEALEAAREAQAALAGLENRAQQGSGQEDEAADEFGSGSQVKQDGPIHRVEIEAAEVVPAHSGRAARGFVARVHRRPANDAASVATRGRFGPRGTAPSDAETHVFSDHRDLVSFLRDELRRDESGKDSRPRHQG